MIEPSCDRRASTPKRKFISPTHATLPRLLPNLGSGKTRIARARWFSSRADRLLSHALRAKNRQRHPREQRDTPRSRRELGHAEPAFFCPQPFRSSGGVGSAVVGAHHRGFGGAALALDLPPTGRDAPAQRVRDGG